MAAPSRYLYQYWLYCSLGTNFSEFYIDLLTFSSKKYIWKCRLQVVGHFMLVYNVWVCCGMWSLWQVSFGNTRVCSARPPHDDVIKWKHFPRYWPFVRGIHRSPLNSPQKGQWRGALMFSLICARINGWSNNGEAGDLRRNRAHYDVIVMSIRHDDEPWMNTIIL